MIDNVNKVEVPWYYPRQLGKLAQLYEVNGIKRDEAAFKNYV